MSKSTKSILDKLTALWALNESGLGGFLHVFNTPFTGIIVGGISILIISLIAFYAEEKWKAILKALVIVLIIKMAVSPYSPFGAYVAVSFQAIFGGILFSFLSWRGLTLVIFGLITFLQSALQKLIILTVIYGTAFWEAINIYGQWVRDKLGIVSDTSTVKILIALYIFIYATTGVLTGLFIRSIINIISERSNDFYLKSFNRVFSKKKSKPKPKIKIVWVWLIIVGLIVLAFSFFGDSLFGWKKGVYLVLRSLLILLLWYLVIGPLVMSIIKKYLSDKKSQYHHDISQTMDLLPYFREIVTYTWKETKDLKGYKRFKYFVANSISNCIHFKGDLE